MMGKMILKPCDFPCSLNDCPPGPLAIPQNDGTWNLGFKSEYVRENGSIEAYNIAGESLWLEPNALVTPLEMYWVVEE